MGNTNTLNLDININTILVRSYKFQQDLKNLNGIKSENDNNCG